MPPKRPLLVFALVLRVLLGAWFALSGGEKLFATGLSAFTRAIANYRMTGPPWDAVLAYVIPWLELTAGLCLILGVLRKGALLVIAGLVVMFSIGVGYAWSQGLDIACGCRGSAEAMNYWGKAAEFAVYFIVLGFLAWAEGRKPEPAGGADEGAKVAA